MNTLELVIPHGDIMGQPGQPFDAGQVTALSTLAAASSVGISPFEALAIGGDSDPHGGFHLDQNGLNNYLTYLLNHN